MTQIRDPNAVHCLDLVKSNDLDRYLSTLLAGKDKHGALFAVYAFDAEICNIAGQVSEPAIGEIRLQWWRDAIEGVFDGNCDDHPVAKELQLVVHKYDLPKHLFNKLIDAHQFDFYREPMASVEDLIAYQTATSAAVADLVARVLIGYDALEIDDLIGQAGVARGLGKMLRTLPQQVARKQCFVPADLLAKHKLDFRNVVAGENSKGMQLVVSQLCHMVSDNLRQLRQGQERLNKDVLPAFWPASLADLNFNKSSGSTSNPLRNLTATSQLKMQWFLFKKSFFERI